MDTVEIKNHEYYGVKQERWDNYFHKLCEAIASKSPCLSRQIGVVLVRDNSVVSTGFNGPARGYKHCEGVDHVVGINYDDPEKFIEHSSCPRRFAGFESGQALHLCPAGHAEVNAISNAARLGVPVSGCTLYMNCIIPCKDCSIQIVNSGIVEVVVDELEFYHEMSEGIFESGGVMIRRFRR